MAVVKRPTIPKAVERELWGISAGRCEFRGCNRPLHVDPLTKKRSNLARISHIVAASPDGPRGDPERSPRLAKDIRNLMLTCQDHAKVIDDHDKVADYPEELLLEFKREHEERIRILTAIGPEAQSHVLVVEAGIDGDPVEIDETQIHRALLPLYPAEEHPTVIDLGTTARADRPEAFVPVAAELEERIRDVLRPRKGRPPIRNLAVFALAPVPLLIRLGLLLGDVQRVSLYQRHRDDQDWIWPEEDEDPAADLFQIRVPEDNAGDREIGLVLSVSHLVAEEEALAHIGDNAIIYGIKASDPGLDFLRSKTRLKLFGYEVRQLLERIRRAHGRDRPVHVFAALPSPAAIELGRSIKASHPPLLVYEYFKRERRYVPVLTMNAGPAADAPR